MHIRDLRHTTHTIRRVSHAVTVYMASIYNTKAAFTSSLQQDTLEHMTSYTYLPLQLLPARTHSNIQIYTLHMPKSGKAATHRARQKGTRVPRGVGACSPPHRALELQAEAQARTESGAAPRDGPPPGRGKHRDTTPGMGTCVRCVPPIWEMLERPKS